MGFASLKDINNAYVNGQWKYTAWRKIPSQATTAGIWFDMSMAGGNPVPNYYASTPLIAAVLNGAEGLFHGGNVSPLSKHVHKLMVCTLTAGAVPMRLLLCDYLLYYPFVDMGVTDPQAMDNTVVIPRYTSGLGVQMIAVEVFSQIGGSYFTVNYTNQAGVSGRTTPSIQCNTATSTGTLVNTAPATSGCMGSPFLPLAAGDTGVRSIQSVTFSTTDVGLIALVLVKPIAGCLLRGIDAPAELDFMVDAPSLPVVADGAYLNFLAYPAGNASGATLLGDATFVWG